MRAILALLLLAPLAWGQTVKMPEQVVLDTSVGLPMSVVIEWDGDDVSWTPKLGDEIVVFREHSTDPKSVKLMLFVARGAKDGTYYLQAAACKDKKMSPFASTKVVVRGGPPQPKPPDPPGPSPLSPLAKAFKDAAAGDSESLAALAAFYAEAGAFLDASDIDTGRKLADKMRQAALKMVPADKVTKVRELIADEYAKAMPADEFAPFTPDVRQVCRALFKRIASALGEAAK